MRRAKLHGVGDVLVCCVLSLMVMAPAEASRTEAVLSWDDGVWDSINHQVTGHVGMKLAVMFQAPEWATWVTEIHYYIGDDLLPDPTESFLAYVWKPDDGTPALPGEPASPGVDSGFAYPKSAWLEIALPEAVNIADPVAFPDRVFFVGLEWSNRTNPYIAEDYSEPIDQMSWRFNWAVWELRENMDTMIRAVVSDTLSSPVESRTWSRVKALFK